MKYFITDRRCGLGDALLNLAATWWLAKEFKRSVITDWSKLPYTVSNWDRDGGNFHRHSINLFPSLFRPPAPLEGVVFEQPEQFRELFFDEWNHALQDVNELPLIKPDTPFTTLEKELAEEKIIRVRPRIGARCGYPNFPKGSEFDFVSFFNHLKLQSVIQDKLSAFKEEHFGSKKIVGLHLRHGSGESNPNQKRGAQSVRTYVEAALKTVESQVRGLDECAVFVCTDDGDCETVALDLFPNSFSFPKALPKESDGLEHQHEAHQQALHYNPSMNTIDSVQDSLIDLILLSECEIFAGSKGSVFTVLARAKAGKIIPLDNILYMG